MGGGGVISTSSVLIDLLEGEVGRELETSMVSVLLERSQLLPIFLNFKGANFSISFLPHFFPVEITGGSKDVKSFTLKVLNKLQFSTNVFSIFRREGVTAKIS